MCESLKQLAAALKESSTTVQDAINAGIKAQIQTSKEMLAFVRSYIAERINCEKVFTEDVSVCKNYFKFRNSFCNFFNFSIFFNIRFLVFF